MEIFNERMRVNGNLISDDDIVRLSAKVKPAAERAERECGRFPKQFEFVTAIAFLYFAEQNCDYVVLETGMGGLLDATNIIEKPVMSIITSVGLDHTHILGNTLEEIAEMARQEGVEQGKKAGEKEGFEQGLLLAKQVIRLAKEGHSVEEMAEICGIPAEKIREITED